ncbi:MAG: DEAD/DEAH box helicase [Thermoleophilia bacterium]|nr:DEAD/DEAH box helicase [Thermoleophilia bacterium]
MSDATFASIGVSEPVCAVLDGKGFTAPFPVQEMVIPEALEGRDLTVRAPTGSGKTLAFALPTIEYLHEPHGFPGALVLAPTRELAVQIANEITLFAEARGLKTATAYGGVPLDRQAKKASSADIIVATPGRLLDLMRQGLIDLSKIEVLILDEADRMLDMGFIPQVEAILKGLPDDRQTMLFSATLDGDIARLADKMTRSPGLIETEDDPGTDIALSERLEQTFVACEPSNRTETLIDIVQEEEDLVLVFCRTRRGAARLTERMNKMGLPAKELHGDLSQSVRESTLKSFIAGTTRVLIATDVASRGIDLDNIGLVVNFDPPDDHDTYTHRVGRTARAGRTGRAITMVLPDQTDEVGRMAKRIGQETSWSDSGFRDPLPKVMYASRGSRVFRPAKTTISTTPAQAAARQSSRVPRGSRTP